MWTVWWAWLLAAVLLGILEMLAPTYILLGFSIGAGAVGIGLLTGLLSPLLGMTGGYAFAWLMVIFAVLSGLAWLALRWMFGKPGEAKTFEHDVND